MAHRTLGIWILGRIWDFHTDAGATPGWAIERFARGVLERLIRRQHARRRNAPADDRGRRPGDHAVLGERLDGAEQPLARQDDAAVGRDERLFGAIDDRSHALLQRRVLHREPFDAAVGPARLLRGAIHQVVVVLVRERTIGSGHDFAWMPLPSRIADNSASVKSRVGW